MSDRLRCRHCPRSTGSSADAARMQGWRMFTGTTLGGQPLEDVVCPHCAGTAPVKEDAPSWRVRCRTCDWEYEDEDGEGLLNAKDARYLARDHECEPWVELAPPGSDTWYSRTRIRDDGSIVGDERINKMVGADR